MSRKLRVLGVSTADVHNRRFTSVPSRTAGFWREVDQQFELVDTVNPTIPFFTRATRRLLARAKPAGDRFSWTTFSPQVFDLRTKAVRQQIFAVKKPWDLVIQEGIYNSLPPEAGPYVVYTDATYELVERYGGAHGVLRNRASDRSAWLTRERELYGNSQVVLTMAEFSRRSVIEFYGLAESKVHAIGAGLNIPLRSSEPEKMKKRVALFVGYDFTRKGGNTLLDAWPSVHGSFPDAELWIAGPDVGRNAPQPRIPGVVWLGRIKDQAALQKIYDQALVFVLPSLWEAYGHVFDEALSYGLPCIGTAHCSMPEIIGDKHGWLVSPGNAHALANALREALENPQRTMKLVNPATVKIKTWGQVVNRLKELVSP